MIAPLPPQLGHTRGYVKPPEVGGLIPLVHRRLIQQRGKRIPLSTLARLHGHGKDLNDRGLLLCAGEQVCSNSRHCPAPNNRSSQQTTAFMAACWPVPHPQPRPVQKSNPQRQAHEDTPRKQDQTTGVKSTQSSSEELQVRDDASKDRCRHHPPPPSQCGPTYPISLAGQTTAVPLTVAAPSVCRPPPKSTSKP